MFFLIGYENFKVLFSGKSTCLSGEPKTDIYVLFKNVENYKKSNTDFLENKISAERAEAILGKNWSEIIQKSTLQLESSFNNRTLIYKNQQGRTNAVSITLGWKFELANKSNGELSNRILLNHQQIVDIYSGSNLPDSKKNAFVNDIQIANYILVGNIETFNDVQAILSNLISIDEYSKQNPNIYFARKALNYRTFERKFDVNRALSVFVEWNSVNSKLTPNISFHSPLVVKGNIVVSKLLNTLSELNILTTNDITTSNVSSLNYIY